MNIWFLRTTRMFQNWYLLMTTSFWDVAPCILVEANRCFRGPYCLHHKGEEWLIACRISNPSSSPHLPSHAAQWPCPCTLFPVFFSERLSLIKTHFLSEGRIFQKIFLKLWGNFRSSDVLYKERKHRASTLFTAATKQANPLSSCSVQNFWLI
jgi:hypothetical protein